MTKVIVTLEMEVPNVEDFTEQELEQLLFDEVVNSLTLSHLEAAMAWCAKGKVGSAEEDPSNRLIYEHQKLWGEICKNAKWSLTRL